MLEKLQVFLFKKYKLSVWSFPANNDSKFHLVFLFIWTKTTADRFNCNLFSFFMRRKNLLLKHVITGGGEGGGLVAREIYTRWSIKISQGCTSITLVSCQDLRSR